MASNAVSFTMSWFEYFPWVANAVTLEMKKPNIVLIFLDSARRDIFGIYGNNEGLTPNIDKLARSGLILNDHYAASCGSAASHVSIFTGQHPQRHGMLHNLCEVNPNIVAFPTLLRKWGYHNCGHCKMSFIPPVGYEELFGFCELKWDNTLAMLRTVPGTAAPEC